MAGSAYDQAPRGRHTVSLFVLAIVVLSLLIQRVVSGTNSVTVLETPLPTPTSAPAAAVVPPTATAAPTSTPVPPTATTPPTDTPRPTSTPVPPTSTPRPPTATLVPPTATPVPPTNTPEPPPPTRAPAPPPAAAPKPGARTVKIIRDEKAKPALLRSRSDVGALVIGEIPADTVVELLGQENGQAVVAGNNVWYKVSYGGQTGFVYSALATPVP